MLKIVLLFVALISLGSCSGMEWDRPSQRYRDCLRNNQADQSVCDKYREQYEEKIDSKTGAPDNQHGDGQMYER